MTESLSPDALLDEGLSAAVLAGGASGVPLQALWDAAHQVEPELAWSAGRRGRLADALNRLRVSGVVAFSTRSGSMDLSGDPSLPLRARPAASVPKPVLTPRPVVSDSWRPELARARAVERLRPDELAVLNRVNEWLRDVPQGEPVRPLRERSWQIFGDEKRLDSLVRQRLFRDGVLSLGLLRAVQVHPPFVHVRVADSGAAFICENHQTYHSAVEVLRADPRGFAVVGYGAGRQFQASVSYVEDLGVTDQVVYFGDLDAEGLAIAKGAAAEAERLGLPPVVPATPLYDLLIAEERRAKSKRVGDAVASELVSWLAPHQRQPVSDLLQAGRRVPQEAIGAAELRVSLAVR